MLISLLTKVLLHNRISPKFDAFSDKYTKLQFYRVNVDNVDEVAAECGIRSGRKVLSWPILLLTS